MKENEIERLARYLSEIERNQGAGAAQPASGASAKDELAALLQTAQMLRRAPPLSPSPAFKRLARQRLLSRISQEKTVTKRASKRHKDQTVVSLKHRYFVTVFRPRRKTVVWILLTAMLASLFGGGGVVYAAADALPGDGFYPVKTLVEEFRLAVSGDEADFDLHLEFANQRLSEIEALMEEERFDDLDEAVGHYGAVISELARVMAALHPDDPARDEAHAALLREARSVHTRVLMGLLEKVPDQAKPGILRAIEASSKYGYEDGLDDPDLDEPEEDELDGKGKPEDKGKPADTGKPEDKGPPENPGPPEGIGPPVNPGPPDELDDPDYEGMGPPKGTGKPDMPGGGRP